MKTENKKSVIGASSSGERTDEEGATTVLRKPNRYIKFKNIIDSQSFLRLVENPDEHLDGVEANIIKTDATTKVGQVTLDGKLLVLKRYNIKGPLHALKRAPRPSRAVNNWHCSNLLQSAGILTPTVFAIIEHRYGPFRGRAYLLMEHITGKLLSDLYLNDPPNLNKPERLQLEIVDLFATLWRNRISHGDMKATNILVKNARPVLLDLDATRQHRSHAQLSAFAAKDIERFLKNWQNLPELHTWFKEQLDQLKLAIS